MSKRLLKLFSRRQKLTAFVMIGTLRVEQVLQAVRVVIIEALLYMYFSLTNLYLVFHPFITG